ncbi:MAG TPA: hypothetical protein PLW99_01950 [Candidatus Paceibacterota bacterium]|nr:hypothetical protein [Candidatus Paceibacterota bacterium]
MRDWKKGGAGCAGCGVMRRRVVRHRRDRKVRGRPVQSGAAGGSAAILECVPVRGSPSGVLGQELVLVLDS